MKTIKSWWALVVREYLEHRMSFVYFPVGILTLMVLAAGSGLSVNHMRVLNELPFAGSLKIFELGYLALIALWFGYYGVAVFFYFGDAFSADRRNNAMFFWKSMPVSDLKILAAKFLAAVTLFPLLILAIAAASGLFFYGLLNIVALSLPSLVPPSPGEALVSFLNITLFATVHVALAMLWYAPFMAWVGGLSTVVGRWSLPLAFVIPGLLTVVENIVAFGQGPQGGYVWAFLSRRWQFGLSEIELGLLAGAPTQFDARTYIWLLVRGIDWTNLAAGLVFSAIAIWLASDYRRRRMA